MHRVELKANYKRENPCYRSVLFLMHRVELKEPKELTREEKEKLSS